MQVGVILGDVPSSTEPRVQVRDLLAQVAAAQEAGLTHVTIGQHLLYGEQRWLQPVPTLARLAAEVSPATRLATTVLVLPLHHPVLLAEELATLDIVSEGRLVVGLGLGYRRAEYAAMGVPFAERVPRFVEALEVLRAMWTEDEVAHRGRHFTVEGAPHIRPWQRPHPPIWIGAQAEAGVRRSARLGDAWPIGPSLRPDEIAALLHTYAEARAEVGRTVGPQPLRRDVSFGPTREAAVAHFLDGAVARVAAYAAKEHAVHAGASDRASVAAGLDATLVAGTVEDCAAQLAALAGRFPVDPVIVRAQWPGTDQAETLAFLRRLGELAAAVAEL